MTTLEEKIIARLGRHRADLCEKQKQLDDSMKEFLEQRDRMHAVAEEKINRVVLPRMEQLVRQFENADIEVLHTDEGYTCLGKFSHTSRFPATVRLGMALLFSRPGELTARYDLSILPALMEYNQNAQERFSVEDEHSLAEWVEEKILAFMDDYLRLETHPLYQKDNLVLDVVCGMRIPSVSASSTLERNGHTYYFCSEQCRNKFLEKFGAPRS